MKKKKIFKILITCFSLCSTIFLALSIYTNVVLSSLDAKITKEEQSLKDLNNNEKILTEKVEETKTDEFIDSYKRQVLGYGKSNEKYQLE